VTASPNHATMLDATTSPASASGRMRLSVMISRRKRC
jgi:hypothetical protein